MLKNFCSSAAFISFVINGVMSHGMMIGTIDCNTKELIGRVRGYDKVQYYVSELRDPSGIGAFGPLCRGEPASSPTDIDIVPGQKVCVALAMSIGAEHQGPCTLSLVDDSGKEVEIASGENCAGQVNGKGTPASGLCPDRLVPGLTADDMCRVDWEVTVNADAQIPSGASTLRFGWIGQHVSPPEMFENCQDVNVKGGNPQSARSAGKKTTTGNSHGNGNTPEIPTAAHNPQPSAPTPEIPGQAQEPLASAPTPEIPAQAQVPQVSPPTPEIPAQAQEPQAPSQPFDDGLWYPGKYE